jgi:hypothetical protein
MKSMKHTHEGVKAGESRMMQSYDAHCAMGKGTGGPSKSGVPAMQGMGGGSSKSGASKVVKMSIHSKTY